jgi:hypothetical protein
VYYGQSPAALRRTRGRSSAVHGRCSRECQRNHSALCVALLSALPQPPRGNRALPLTSGAEALNDGHQRHKRRFGSHWKITPRLKCAWAYFSSIASALRLCVTACAVARQRRPPIR